MEEINIFNLYDHVTMTFDGNLLKIEWDYKNPTLNSLMLLEKQPYTFVGDKHMYSCKWVEEIKKKLSWQVGTPIHIRIQPLHTDGRFWITIYNEPQDCYIYEKIDEDGYLISAYYTFYNSCCIDLVKVNCYYNDLLDEEQSPYTLK